MTLRTKTHGAEGLARIAGRIEAALGELHHYYKFGRHLEDAQQKAYLLFSQCGQLLFSLWMMEQQTASGIVEANPTLAKLFGTLDFETLRDDDCRRHILHAEGRETHPGNESRWFRFWTDALGDLEGTGASDIGRFSECVLKRFVGDDLPDKEPTKDERRALVDMLRSAQTGSLFLHSTRILEDLLAHLAEFFAQLDPVIHANEQVQSLAHLLRQIRRTIVYESVVRGPYVMSDDVGWEPSSARLRLSCGRTFGLLTVAAKDQSGEFICTYAVERRAKKKEHSWSRAISALPCGYEEMLFKTWAYETGEHHRIVDFFGQARACWIVDSAEADRLETICRHVDTLIERLGTRREYDTATRHIASIARNDQSKWTPTELRWTYIRDLDKTISKLEFASRQAAAPSGNNAMAEVISDLWPPESSEPQRIESDRSNEPAPGPETSGEDVPEPASADPHNGRPHCERTTTTGVDVARQESPTDSETPGRSAVSEAPREPTSQDRVPASPDTEADRNAAQDHATIPEEGVTTPQATSLLTEPPESVQGQTPEDATAADPGATTDDPGQATSSSTPPSPRATSLQEQDRERSSQAEEHRKRAARRAKKLAATMSALLGESIKGNGPAE